MHRPVPQHCLHFQACNRQEVITDPRQGFASRMASVATHDGVYT